VFTVFVLKQQLVVATSLLALRLTHRYMHHSCNTQLFYQRLQTFKKIISITSAFRNVFNFLQHLLQLWFTLLSLVFMSKSAASNDRIQIQKRGA